MLRPIRQYRSEGAVEVAAGRRRRFAAKYTDPDIAPLAEVDSAGDSASSSCGLVASALRRIVFSLDNDLSWMSATRKLKPETREGTSAGEVRQND
jgi:hypothetical protein